MQSLSRLLLTKDSIMALNFEWDANKAKSNLRKHGISFVEASAVFGDPRSLTIPDPIHSALENRFITIGLRIVENCSLSSIPTEATIFASSARESRADKNDGIMKKPVKRTTRCCESTIFRKASAENTRAVTRGEVTSSYWNRT